MASDLRGYIESVIDSLGIKFKSDIDFRTISAIIEACVVNPDMALTEVIDGVCNARGLMRRAVDRLIDTAFDVYNEDKLKSISEYTQTTPITDKDALYDIAVTVRIKYDPV